MSAVDSKAWLQFYPEWTPHSLDYGETTLLDVYDNNLAINPDKPATYFFGRTQTFSDLDRQVRRAAAGLRAFGVRPGDRVAIVAPNCPQYVAAFYAILKLGAVAVLHNPLYTAHELEGLFKDHGARIAIAWDKTASTLEKLRGSTDLETVISINMIDAMPTAQRLALRLPFLKSTREQLSGEAPNTVPWDTLIGDAIGGDGKDLKNPPEVTKDTIAVIMYTSGTTGQPKGAQLSHGNFFAVILQGKNWVPGLGDRPERMLAALPFFHAYGLTMNVVLQPLIGGELVIIPKPDIALIMKLMKKHTPTWIPGVPTLYQRIVEAAEKDGVDIKGVRAAFSGASTLPVDTVEKWEKYTGGLLVEGYGLTECSPIIVGNPMTTDRRPGYVGIPFPDTEVRIANPDNLDETQPDGTAGEVLARGHQVFKGYLNNPEATAAAFHNGWFRTGDMGIMDSNGFIRLVSRIKEIIITGGFNVYPGEVEEVLRTHPSIDDVAVVGRPRPDGSEDVVACIDLSDGAALDPEGLKDFCRERLTRYKVPRTFYHFQELPKDQMGKIRRREVQAALLERLAAEEKH
ncbi:long-chain-fatty-acid--CoA ligase [Corynebacterium flavescens]|uniref:long-chain-fatty-acid--CoA ligase n=1 Tax=Corynebacterium flavescens TaxID=28028 RepID=UPI0026497F0D|nr:long-chain-fatty-acid--CoA ligase [Corynebacterium flavescens]MDN6236562.1 long-chain fatty acid--CoA ligase [Corynebacterium flavescens]MDN6432166.1 long-chain fatty acid--CoA ligase [Corynebacterium flavescens]MDN6531701.1 long-chain fatty acid--CoA ligase [Corynebacterium flavescens]MDN6601324.1 long-chain fatty acid--CoA ligase [Corynebacterium flavescens]MDN6688205.1 long-chain fatty acid--CoA ligase [Corynebacterium flavescens]